MKAMRWILFCLLAFGLGTGAAFAFHPPTIGIPSASASDLAGDLTKIKSFAAAGRCEAVRGHLSSAAATIDDLPAATNATTVSQLNDSLAKVKSAALTTCQQVAEAKIASDQAKVAATTPTPTPEPATPTPNETPAATSPDTSGGTGTDQTSPDGGAPVTTSPSSSDQGNQNDQGGVTLPNGVTIPGPDAVRQKIDKKIEKARGKIEKALGN